MEWFPWLLCPFGCTLSTRQLPWYSGGFNPAGFGSSCTFAAGARLQLNICLSKSAKLLENFKVWGIFFLVGFLFLVWFYFLGGFWRFLVGCCWVVLGFFFWSWERQEAQSLGLGFYPNNSMSLHRLALQKATSTSSGASRWSLKNSINIQPHLC